jgi:hypothetical protein
MAQYQIFAMDRNGLIVDGVDIECATDLEAMERAATLLRNCAQIEVWTSTRRVGILSSTCPDGLDGQAP